MLTYRNVFIFYLLVLSFAAFTIIPYVDSYSANINSVKKIRLMIIESGIIQYNYFTPKVIAMLTKSIPTKFDEQDLSRLNYIAKLYDRPVSYLIREATRDYLDAQAKKLEFLEEARTAFANYKDRGLHCEHKEVKSWLNDLAQGKNVGRPKCHK